MDNLTIDGAIRKLERFKEIKKKIEELPGIVNQLRNTPINEIDSVIGKLEAITKELSSLKSSKHWWENKAPPGTPIVRSKKSKPDQLKEEIVNILSQKELKTREIFDQLLERGLFQDSGIDYAYVRGFLRDMNFKHKLIERVSTERNSAWKRRLRKVVRVDDRKSDMFDNVDTNNNRKEED